jgi:hypothetical protein
MKCFNVALRGREQDLVNLGSHGYEIRKFPGRYGILLLGCCGEYTTRYNSDWLQETREQLQLSRNIGPLLPINLPGLTGGEPRQLLSARSFIGCA